MPIEQECITLWEAYSQARTSATSSSSSSSSTTTSCFHSLYVKWLEAAGARVVPVPYDLPRSNMSSLIGSLNGLLFTGGETPITEMHSQYMEAAGYLLNYTIASNDQGTHLPLWGTCMGMQTLSVLVGGPGVLESKSFSGVDPAMLPLDMTDAADQSQLFGTATTPSRIRQILETKKVTTNLHHDGVDPSTFSSNSRLASFYNVLSTNVDADSKPFVSTMESIKYPIFGAQWHPERPQFEWRAQPDPINHEDEAIEAMQWIARFFVNEARKNNRSFPSQEEADTHLIYNFRPVGDTSYQAYLF